MGQTGFFDLFVAIFLLHEVSSGFSPQMPGQQSSFYSPVRDLGRISGWEAILGHYIRECVVFSGYSGAFCFDVLYLICVFGD